MRFVPVLVLAAASSTAALAQSDKDHAAHHPAGAEAAAASTSPAKPADKATAAAPAQMDMQMKSMREMHDKMMAAKTPEERHALMGEHMKAMQCGMAVMGRMQGPDGKGGGMAMNPEMMAKRMEMMETMMQMMLDREAARAPAAK